MLSYGALPLTFDERDVTTVTAALGGEQLQAGLIAGAIGLALVVIYLVVYYRGLGTDRHRSACWSPAVLTYAIMSLLGPAIGFALNLPAVCGAIVAIGITADSFIVYFERIRDEIREGRTLRPAVERGLAARPAHHPGLRLRVVPRRRGAVHRLGRQGAGLRVHAGSDHRCSTSSWCSSSPSR